MPNRYRFVFLKLYENANYNSRIQAIQEQRTIKFNINFDTEDLKKESVEVEKNETEISLTKLRYIRLERASFHAKYAYESERSDAT